MPLLTYIHAFESAHTTADAVAVSGFEIIPPYRP